MADELKRALLAAHPEYTYKPRKPSEKKKRARRNTQSQHSPAQDDGDSFMVSPPGNPVEDDGSAH